MFCPHTWLLLLIHYVTSFFYIPLTLLRFVTLFVVMKICCCYFDDDPWVKPTLCVWLLSGHFLVQGVKMRDERQDQKFSVMRKKGWKVFLMIQFNLMVHDIETLESHFDLWVNRRWLFDLSFGGKGNVIHNNLPEEEDSRKERETTSWETRNISNAWSHENANKRNSF